MPVFYEVATLNDPVVDPPFALIRIDTDRPMGQGVEGVIVSLHWSEDEARAAAELALSETEGRA
jgi:hypothetical protein